MHYCTEYEICALVFLIVITIRFFSMRMFPNRLNRLFGIIVICAIIDLALDIIGAYTIEYAAVLPPVANYAVNTLFYSIQVIFPALMLVYVLIMVNRDKGRFRFLLYMPAIIFELLLIINPFTDVIFYLRETTSGLVYTRGSLFNFMYIGSGFYMLFTVIAVFKYRTNLKKTEYISILSFILIIAAFMLLQYLFPSILLTGVAITLSILMMFFTIQNPEAMLDLITGLFNYSALNEFLRGCISEKRAMWLIAVDVGGIRSINSTLGMRSGNELLSGVGKFFNAVCGTSATAFRMIGTRFLIVADNAEAHSYIEQIIAERFRQPWKCGDFEIPLIATIRYSDNESYFESPEDVINLIDLAFSRLAREEFGTSKLIDAGFLAQARRRMNIEEGIKHAVSTGVGFSLNYQPVYSLASGSFSSAEVLLRLNIPGLGPISPSEFIPIAESSGLIRSIDSMVLDMACEFMSCRPELIDYGLEQLEINLSAAEFNAEPLELSSKILELPASMKKRLCFEVTETAATTNRGILCDFMQSLISQGVSFALDDFGMGYANITQIASLPFSTVKLDRSFIVSESSRDRLILTDLIKMFERIGLETIVEGVETAEQAAVVRRLGAGRIQGYLYSRPLAENEFFGFMEKQRQPIVHNITAGTV